MTEHVICELPQGWVRAKLPDAVDLILGQSPSSDDCNSEGEGLPFYQGKTEFGKLYPTVRRYCTVPKKLAKKNDVLLSVRAPVGPTNLATEKCVIGRGLAVLRGNENVDFKYVLSYMRHIEPWLSEQGTGTTFRAVSGVFLKELDFQVAPIAEQKRIVEKLDSLLAQVDTIQQRLNTLPNIIKRFRQSVLAAAVSGKLTEQWRSDNAQLSAAKILVKLAKVRESGFEIEIEDGNKETKRLLSKIKKHNPELPKVDLPNTWVWTSFMASMEKVVDCHNKTAPYIDEGIPLIRTPDIRDGKISLKGAKYISQETYDYWSRRCPPKSGDIIFTREAPMGEAGIVPEDTVLCMGQRMMLLRPMKEFVNPEYILLNILSLNFQERMNKDAIGTGVKHLRVADVEALSYPLAPLEEQTEIVRLVEQYFALADTLEKHLKNAKQRVDNLTQAILAKAFKGELVPQDPSDEPAEQLLARIKAARKQAEALEKAANKAAKTSKNKNK